MLKVDGHLVDRVGPYPAAVSSPPGSPRTSQWRDPTGPVLGGHMDTNRVFTNLFGGWLTAADKAAAATFNYTKSTVLPRVSDLTQKATLATGGLTTRS
jgi:hypothetical protein